MLGFASVCVFCFLSVCLFAVLFHLTSLGDTYYYPKALYLALQTIPGVVGWCDGPG